MGSFSSSRLSRAPRERGGRCGWWTKLPADEAHEVGRERRGERPGALTNSVRELRVVHYLVSAKLQVDRISSPLRRR